MTQLYWQEAPAVAALGSCNFLEFTAEPRTRAGQGNAGGAQPCTERDLADVRLARAQDQALGIPPHLTRQVADEYKYLQQQCTELAVVHHSYAELGADHGVGGNVSDPHRGTTWPALIVAPQAISYDLRSSILPEAHTCHSSTQCAKAAFSCLQPLRCKQSRRPS